MDADYFLAITAAARPHSSALLPAAHILVSCVLRPLVLPLLSLSLSLTHMHDAVDVVPGARRTVNWLSILNKLHSPPLRAPSECGIPFDQRSFTSHRDSNDECRLLEILQLENSGLRFHWNRSRARARISRTSSRFAIRGNAMGSCRWNSERRFGFGITRVASRSNAPAWSFSGLLK